MAAKVPKGNTRRSKPVVTKTSLNSPYEKIWTPVVGEDMQHILKTLTDKFTQLGLKKVEIQKKFVRKGKKSKESSDENIPNPESPKEPLKEGPVTSGWTQSDVRKHLAIGINEVTRALERDDARLVIVCKSAKPEMITKHLLELSASREVPACQLPRLSENLAPVLGLRSVLALAFRKSSHIFLEQVQVIAPMVPPLNVPWLAGQSDKTQGEPAHDTQPEGDENKEASRKRKLPPSKPSTGAKLQGLRVKKIVPNPNKKRKTKIKKTAKKK